MVEFFLYVIITFNNGTTQFLPVADVGPKWMDCVPTALHVDEEYRKAFKDVKDLEIYCVPVDQATLPR